MTEECDVLIVGGGPAGLAAAEAAAKLNARTVLLERQNEIGKAVGVRERNQAEIRQIGTQAHGADDVPGIGTELRCCESH